MFDNIRLKLKYNFTDEELQVFCNKHDLRSEQAKGTFSNKQTKNLTQNKGIFIKVETTPKIITIEFSLHKLYNEFTDGKRQNWNDFNFMQAATATEYLKEFIGLDLQNAKITKYEAGINIQCNKPPETYLKEMDCITIKNRVMRILEDVKYKEYKQYSTNRSREKRIVYVFYDKTFEAKSKASQDNKNTIPDNILRIEMKYKRLDEPLKFGRLFEADFQKELIKEFAEKITDCLKFKTKQKEPHQLTPKQFEIYKNLKRHGIKKEKEANKADYKEKRITKRQYYYKENLINELAQIKEELETVTDEVKELQTKIQAKILSYKNFCKWYTQIIINSNKDNAPTDKTAKDR